MGYLVLVMHILLMLGLAIAVVLLKGFYDFRWLILILGIVVIGGSAYYFYRRIRQSNRKLGDLMSDPALQNRSVEIRLLGGMATLKLGQRDEGIRLIEEVDGNSARQLEPPKSKHLEELSEINRMLEDGLITREEFLRLKKEII